MNMSCTSVHRVLSDLQLYPYKVHVVHELEPEDYQNLVTFAEEELQRIPTNASHLSFLAFSDEAHSHLDGFHYSSQYAILVPR